jgi:hypothetical protein
MKKRSFLCIVLAVSLILSACAKKSTSSQTADKAAASKSNNLSMRNSAISGSVAPSAAAMDASKPEYKADEKQKQSTSSEEEQNKKIIKNASLYIVEENLDNLSQSISKKVGELGGYIESERTMEQMLNMTVRIPAQRFDDFITYTENGFAVKDKNVSSQNITDVYVDNEARLNNLKAQEEQILTILKKANTVEEVLKVQAELYRIRGEAEALEARKKNWDKQVDYATITINADRKTVVVNNKKTIIGGSEFIKSIGTGFNNTAVNLILAIQNILIFIFSNIILLALLALAGFFGVRYYKKYKKSR